MDGLFIDTPVIEDRKPEPIKPISAENVKRLVVEHSEWGLTGPDKRKRNHNLNGKVVAYNMYEEIMPFDEFEKLPMETKREVVALWSGRYTLKDIEAVWGKSKWKFSQYKQEFGMTRATKKLAKKQSKKGVEKIVKQAVPPLPVLNTKPTAPVPSDPQSAFSMKKFLRGKDLAKRLVDLAAYFENDESLYETKISILETEGEA